MSKQLKITLVKSLIGRKPSHVQTAHALGLKKMNRVVIKPDNPAIRGMLAKVNYLVSVEEISDAS